MAARKGARTATRRSSRTARGRRPESTNRSRKGPSKIGRLFLPILICVAMAIGIVFLGLMGYRTVTASEFFDVKRVDIRGVQRASKDDIEKVVTMHTERSGAWNADLAEIKARVERLPFVKTAAVSRVLPNGIRISVVERQPQAIVRMSSGDFLVDGEAEILAAAAKNEGGFPITLKGWDESKTEKAAKDNLLRIKLYQKMLSEWGEFELAARVKELNLSAMAEPIATIEDSGKQITVMLGKENFGKNLKAALEAVAGKGDRIKSVNAGGLYPVIEYLSL